MQRRLKALLSSQRRQCAKVSNETAVLQTSITPLERMLRASYSKVVGAGADSDALATSAHTRRATSKAKRDAVLEDLLGQDQVLALLYGDALTSVPLGISF